VASARQAVALLIQLQRASEDERGRLIQSQCSRVHDSGQLSERLSLFTRVASRVRPACYFDMTLLFVAFPVLGHTFGLQRIWLPLLLLVAATGLYICLESRRERATLYCGSDAAPPGWFLALAVSPIDAARAATDLQKHAAAGFDPLAVAATLCDRETFEEEASRRLRQLLHRLPQTDASLPEQFVADDAWFHQVWLRGMADLVSKIVPDPSTLLAAPAREGDRCLSYCPRCCVQYVFDAGKCAECDLAVVSFDSDVPIAEFSSGRR
jgi:hypothetical protein